MCPGHRAPKVAGFSVIETHLYRGWARTHDNRTLHAGAESGGGRSSTVPIGALVKPRTPGKKSVKPPVLDNFDFHVPKSCSHLPDLPHQAELHRQQGATYHALDHEHVLEAVQRRLDEHPEKMRQWREPVELPLGTIKARMGATHFLMKTLLRVATEMALHALAYNLTRVMNIMGPGRLIAAMRTQVVEGQAQLAKAG